MAGSGPGYQLPNGPYFNIYADLPPAGNSLNLPGGQCNYIDLTPGAVSQKCGCRRFWSRTSFGGSQRGSITGFPPGFASGQDDQTAWCMCSHHACFHDDIRDGQSFTVSNSVVTTSFMNAQENERPIPSREPLTPVTTEPYFNFPYSTSQSMDYNISNNPSASFYRQHETPAPAPPNEIVEPARDSPVPDTSSWPSLFQPRPEQNLSHGAILRQRLIPSQPSSTTSSARIAYLKPFGGKGLQTLSGVGNTELEPLGEESRVAVPQVQDAAELDVSRSVDGSETVANTPSPATQTELGEAPAPAPSSSQCGNRLALNLLSNTVQGHEQRLENLESVSFTAAAHDVCHDQHDQADLRITDLETRLEELEKILNAGSGDSPACAPSHHERDDGTESSFVSVATNEGNYSMSRAELQTEVQIIKAKIGELQSVASPVHPWEVEVIFLPFPLRNVWRSSHEFGSQAVEADPWTQMPHASEPQSANHGDLAGPEADSDWLFGRACVPYRTIDMRLRSRGLVQSIAVRGPDARSVQQAISEAFGNSFQTYSRMQSNVYHGSTMHHYVSKFLGLQSPWVPLRKMNKDPRLRFLTPAEMVTSASWDVQFLSSSVVMKSNDVPRLYITHPEAYLQDLSAYENMWTWQRLRELGRVYLNSQNTHASRGDELDECWVWDPRLDEQSSGHGLDELGVNASAQDRWRAMAGKTLPKNVASDTKGKAARMRSVSRALSPAVFLERRASKTPRLRTGSIPPLQTLASSSTSNKRAGSHGLVSGRRFSQPKERSTRSPAVRRGLSRFTPRHTTASPTPGPEAFMTRAITPWYATPFSNGPQVDARPDRLREAVIHGAIDVDFRHLDSDHDIDGNSTGDGDNDDDGDGDDDDDSLMTDVLNELRESEQEGQLPEDDPWPGIEDIENRDPVINIHMDHDAVTVTDGDAATVRAFNGDEHDNLSQGSSAPSEFPSTQPPWDINEKEQEFNGFDGE